MASWFQVRYAVLWVRFVCTFALGIILWRTFELTEFRPMEQILYGHALEGEFYQYRDLPYWGQTSIFFILCLGPAFLRTERPLVMILSGLVLGLVYGACIVAGFFAWRTMLPVTGPILGLIGSTILLASMVWSEERQRRRDLEHLEKSKQHYTDMLVHDLKNRVSSIDTSFRMLKKNIPETTPHDDQLVKTINASSQRIILQMNALLDIRKMEEGKMLLNRQPVFLAPLIENIVREYQAIAELAGITLVTSLDNHPNRSFPLDSDIMARVLGNLVMNSIQHAPKGTTVEICLYSSGCLESEITVANRGSVLNPEQQGAMFGTFMSMRFPGSPSPVSGTGLGLTFCKLAVEAHGGRVEVESPWTAQQDGVQVRVLLGTHSDEAIPSKITSPGTLVVQ